MHDVLKRHVAEALETAGITAGDFAVEFPADLAHGDYSTNVALVAAKGAGKSPREIAEVLVAALEGKIDGVERIEIAGPGFVNFYLSPGAVAAGVGIASDAGSAWGADADRNDELVMVEYTSPNLFKPLHIGNLMSNIVGETLARLTKARGADVLRVNYPSDIGLTVAKGVWGLQKGGYNPDDIADLGLAYRDGSTAYEENAEAKAEIDVINKKLYAGDADLNELRERGIATSKRHLAEICKTLGTEFDLEFFESQSGPVGYDIVRSRVGDVFEESDGAVIFRGEQYGLHTRVFINSADLPTYEAKDIGLMQLKRDAAPFDQSLTITAVEQNEYFKVLIKAAELVFPELVGKVAHVGYGFLTLPTGKMSSRKGNVITGESLIEDMREKALEKMKERELSDDEKREVADMVAVAAIKYGVLKQATGKNIVFDPEQSLSFEGDSGPYLQYTHVRAGAVLRKAESEGVAPSAASAPDTPSDLARHLVRFPEIVARAEREREPHHLTTYLTEIASLFNSFYAAEQIVNKEDPQSPYKVALTAAVATTLKNGLHLLGIKTPEKM